MCDACLLASSWSINPYLLMSYMHNWFNFPCGLTSIYPVTIRPFLYSAHGQSKFFVLISFWGMLLARVFIELIEDTNQDIYISVMAAV